MALEIYADDYKALGYDLAAEVSDYQAALAEYVKTTGVPAPAAKSSVVEIIVKYHDGEFVIVPNPPVATLTPLPRDRSFYRSSAEYKQIAAEEAAALAAKRKQAAKEASPKL